MVRDTDSVLTISLDDVESGGKQCSLRKLDQLAAAREKALLARQKKQKLALEAKLNEIRRVLGSDMRNDTVENFARAMMKQEERLRAKQNALTEQVSQALDGLKDEIRALRKTQPATGPRPEHTKAVSHTAKPVRALSEVSSVSSRAIKM